MHILITDSGVGGLSVCAYAERFLRTHDVGESVKLTYVNASPENDFGYNSMGSREEKIAYFHRFLDIVTDEFSPHLIYIACNTLSVLYPDTGFSKMERVPVRGIVETGVDRLLRELGESSRSVAAIFGTDTTIGEGTYSNLLIANGIAEDRVIPQACPSLADTISEDRRGSASRRKIEGYVRASIERSTLPLDRHLTYLACTHYGYRKAYFSDAFTELGIDTKVLNPNEFVIEDLFAETRSNAISSEIAIDVDVEFITRYKVPETALETIAFFLQEISPKTVKAFKEYTHAPGLF
jgi:glutamate racemase